METLWVNYYATHWTICEGGVGMKHCKGMIVTRSVYLTSLLLGLSVILAQVSQPVTSVVTQICLLLLSQGQKSVVV